MSSRQLSGLATKGLPVLAAMISVGFFTSAGCSAAEDFSDQQRESLAAVFYRGNPLPPPPTDLERKETRAKVRQARRWERRLLKQLYGRDRELWVYATRDSDGDGILDFRVSDYYGRFLEGDTDLDGDGIVNILDGRPFSVDASPLTGSSLPPHLDWEAQGKPAEMVQIQRELYAKYGIVLVERTESFTPQLARAVWDAVTRVYQKVFAQEGSLPTLRTIATEDFSLLDPEDPEGVTDFAQVLAATQTLVIYRRGVESPPAIQLGFLAHEIAHNIQFALDYDDKRQQEIIERNYFAATRFHELVEPFGWTTVPLEIEPRD
ncbi:MAG: thrombospondin type 3 repeat-containing protein, partial [Thermoanaerobaculia bacterium]